MLRHHADATATPPIVAAAYRSGIWLTTSLKRGRGLGRALFRECALPVTQAADTLGICGIVVHAISEQVKAFYLIVGFDPSPADPITLIVTLADIRKVVE